LERKALIKVGYACNNHCAFCHAAHERPVVAGSSGSTAIEAKIALAAALGCQSVVFSGGEPTIHRELRRWARLCAELGLGFGLITNGRMLCYERLVDELVSLGLSYVHLSLHAPMAPVHDQLVGATAFAQTRRALQLLASRVAEVTVNTVVTRRNLDVLGPMVNLVASVPPARLKLHWVEPKGAAAEHFDDLVPRATVAARCVAATMAHARAVAPTLQVEHEGFPLCLLPGLEGQQSGLREHGFVLMAEAGEADFSFVDEGTRILPPRCEDCRLRGRCPGLYAGYYERFGDAELAPAAGLRGNSFNLVLEEELAPTLSGRCAALGRPLHPARHLLVRRGAQLGLFGALSRDFADDDILACRRRGQIYADKREGLLACNDWPHELVKLRRSAVCQDCEAAPYCPGCFEAPGEEDLFSRDDEAVRRRLASMRGDIVDVGCGDGRYGDIWAPLVASGVVRYLGLEPDEAAAQRLRERWPWAEVQSKRAEEPALAAESVDHALLLRSYNHLEQLDVALAHLVAALRPGGSLLVVDNVIFGVVRLPAEAARAEAGPASFEHFRNHGAARARALLETLGLRYLDGAEVGADSSNQWWLHFAKGARP
jgi:uncharacterized Fe-S cluster-containing radical SAM superfamily protein/SAM-dependent methyltransferase